MRSYHPYLFATFFILALYGANAHEVPVSNVAIPLAAVLVLVAAFHVVARFIWGTPLRPAVAATAFAIFLLSFEHVYSGLVWLEGIHGSGHLRLRIVLAAWLLLLICGLVGVHYWCESRAVGAFLNRLGVALLGLALVNILVAQGRTLVRQNKTDAHGDIGMEGTGRATFEKIEQEGDWSAKRDIFFLVFDRYASNETLERDFHYDNTPFRQSLESRGFHWFPDSYTNYPKTAMSMASALNMQYHEGVSDYGHYFQLIQRNAVTRILKEHGYRYFHLGNKYTPLRANPQAYYTFTLSTLPSEFAELVYFTTPLGRAWPLGAASAATITRQFDALESVAQKAGPKFVYAHFLVPHEPYLFGSDGPKWASQLDDRIEDEQYIDQLRYVNGRILDAIDCILASSAEPPVIVVQADEGPNLMAGDGDKTVEQQMRKRCGILAAIRLPGESAVAMPTRLSPVNTFRLILKHQVCPSLEILDDRVFYWAKTAASKDGNDDSELRVTDVTDVVHGPLP